MRRDCRGRDGPFGSHAALPAKHTIGAVARGNFGRRSSQQRSDGGHSRDQGAAHLFRIRVSYFLIAVAFALAVAHRMRPWRPSRRRHPLDTPALPV